MKLGSKKTKQAELLDALGGDVLASSLSEMSAPPTPAPIQGESSAPQKSSSDRGSLPEVTAERYVVSSNILLA